MERRPHELRLGSTIELRSLRGHPLRCEVLGTLDQGTNSRTWLARTDEGQHVALKTSRWIEPGQVDADLRIEEEVLRQVSSESLIKLLASGDGPEGKRILAYERAFPNPLLTLARPEVRRHFPDPGTRFLPLPPPVALQLGCDLLRGLGQMHAQGFVHHDVKVSNLMVRVPETGRVVPDHQVLQHALAGRARGVLIDMGASRSLAYLADLDAGRALADVSVIPPQLTPLYAPPEALALEEGQRPRLLPSLDLYAAAIVVYAGASGRFPYDDHGGEPEEWERLRELKRSERSGKLVPISFDALRKSAGYEPIASDLCSVLRALMDRDPDRRPRARDARAALERLAGSLR